MTSIATTDQTMSMKRHSEEFAQQRTELLRRMLKLGTPAITKVIPFRNDDVPNYLRKLDKFEARSRRAKLIVGAQHAA